MNLDKHRSYRRGAVRSSGLLAHELTAVPDFPNSSNSAKSRPLDKMNRNHIVRPAKHDDGDMPCVHAPSACSDCVPRVHGRTALSAAGVYDRVVGHECAPNVCPFSRSTVFFSDPGAHPSPSPGH